MARSYQNARKAKQKKDPPIEKEESTKFLVAQNLKKLAEKAEKEQTKKGRKRKQTASRGQTKKGEIEKNSASSTSAKSSRPKSLDASSGEYNIRIEAIYKRLITLGVSSRTRNNFSFEKLEESGIIEKQLWPLLVKSVVSKHVDGFQLGENEDQYESKYATLYAILINRRASNSNTSAGNSTLEFITQHNYTSLCKPEQVKQLETKFGTEKGGKLNQSKLVKEAFETLLHDVLLYLENSTFNEKPSKKTIYNTAAINIETECMQFLIHCYASIDVSMDIQNTMLRLSGLPLWEAMSSRRRVMELENCPPLKLLWTRREKEKKIQIQTEEIDGKKEEIGNTGAKRKVNGNHGQKNKRIKDDSGGKKYLFKYESTVLPTIVSKFLNTLNQIDAVYEAINNDDTVIGETMTKAEFLFPSACVSFLHTSLVLFIDLLSLPASRRFFQPYLISTSLTVHCTLSTFFSETNSLQEKSKVNKMKLFQQLLQILIQLENFPMDNYSSKSLSNAEIQKQVHTRCHALQQICFKHFIGPTGGLSDENGVSNVSNPKMLDFAYAGVAYACREHFLRKHLSRLETDDLEKLAHILRLVDNYSNRDESYHLMHMTDEKKRLFLISVLVYRHAIRPSEAISLTQLPLYPAEDVLWDGNLLPDGRFFGGNDENKILALPKLNTQFLTFGDYLLRSFKLMRLESAYGIRGDIVDAVRRSNPVLHHNYSEENTEESDYYGIEDVGDEKTNNKDSAYTTSFNGWARMAIEIMDFEITKVATPKLGETVPAQVLGEIKIDLEPLGTQIRKEWEEIVEFDNLFLISIDAGKMSGAEAPLLNEMSDRRIPDEEDITFPSRYGVTAVRGCMVHEIKDEAGTLLNDPTSLWEKKENEDENQGKPKGTKLFLKVALDPAQYAKDTNTGRSGRIHESFNLLVRRHGRENNFKAVLETIRDLMHTTTQGMKIHKAIPPWLHSVLLGYGDPSSATFSSRTMRAYAERTIGVTHPDAALDYGDTFLDSNHLNESFPDYSLYMDGEEENQKKDASPQVRKNYRIKITEKDKRVDALSYPFLRSKEEGNPIRFTPIQVKAVRSGLSPGLTMIVGPPGTGKTDVAVQIIANLYHSFPTQRTVIVTHSNAALNDLFEKVMARGDVDERYLLRLGSGERDLKTSSLHDFTKLGRVEHILSRRGTLLENVQRLSESLGVSGASERGSDGSPSYTCETAAYFNLHHVQKRIQIFYAGMNSEDGVKETSNYIKKSFPFKAYFNEGEGNTPITLENLKGKFLEIESIFNELAEYRPLELLRSQRQRSDYLLTKQTRIVAMTCTHAAIARSHLIKVGFKYDNILIEEAGQMLEVETFIPMLLQKSASDEESSLCRLKRICLIGDHNQLPPVVKNLAFSKYAHLDQSLFSRLIRLGVPSILLNKQGRARADIAKLYSWRYKGLGDLAHVSSLPGFRVSNAGFLHNFQMVNVEDFEGRGESTPSPYFYQNLGEAEYIVAVFQYMVLVGYSPEKISILATYNGQKQLIQDILAQRCAPGTPLAGILPGAVSTVDQYQGQQNDFILLSLVRTTSVGYLRDIRRLVVAVSRARLGLYVFGRQELFNQCHELWGTLRHFDEKSSKLQIVTGEHFPTSRIVNATVPKQSIYEVKDVVDLGSIVFSMQEQLCN